jgi:FMN-dependent NADH-azoreductase
MTLFRLDASMRADSSVSRRVADVVEAGWRHGRPGSDVVRRDVGRTPLPADAWPHAVAAGGASPSDRTSEQATATALAAQLVDELERADAYLFAVPLYNFGVPHTFKTWVDLAITDPRLRPGSEPLLQGRPAVLVAVRGGGYGPGTPREGWDHGTPWVRRILSDVFRLDLEIVETELTLAPVNPALAELVPLAERSLADALAAAERQGERLAAHAARPTLA